MNCFSRLTLTALIATAVASCGVLEPNVVPASTASITPLITSSGTFSTAGNRASATNVRTALATNTTSGSDLTGSIQQIFNTDRCNKLSRGGFIWFTDSVVLDDWLAPLTPVVAKDVRRQMDFSKQGALLLDYGVAGTSGAGAMVVSKQLEVKGKDAFITVKKINPNATEKKKIQVVTHPCSLYVMPRTGFSTLVIQSEQGDRLTSFANEH